MWATKKTYFFQTFLQENYLLWSIHQNWTTFSQIVCIIILVKPTPKMKIPKKLCGINQNQVVRLRLLTSSSSSKVTSLKITSTPSRPTTMVLNPFHATDLFWYPLKTSESQRFIYIITSQLIWVVYQLTGFYIKGELVLNLLKCLLTETAQL